MKSFMADDFMLTSPTAEKLFHDYAETMPIFDYHCHLPPAQVADNTMFENLTAIWLAGDHYKWRAMRANGVSEDRITGDADDRDKFLAWAETVPHTIGNPLYHWTHMELKKPFGIDGLLNPSTAKGIWDEGNAKLKTEGFRVRSIMNYFNVKAVCTTDDPVDSLEHHKAVAGDPSFPCRMLPTFRPDKAHKLEDPALFLEWFGRLEKAVGRSIATFDEYLGALQERHDYFHELGGRLSDHGIERPEAVEYTHRQVSAIFLKAREGSAVTPDEIAMFRSAMLYELIKMDADSGWVTQIHMGAMRNNSTRMYKTLGPDTGYDSMGDYSLGHSLSRLLDRLDSTDQLPKTVLYTLNPRENELLTTMAGNFQGGGIPGKMQFGSGWWYNDQKDGMLKQMTALANMGLLSRFIGMLTDSRSFLSYPRHDYFRRILCSLVGTWIEEGEAPNDLPLLGGMIQNICYNNVRDYIGIELEN